MSLTSVEQTIYKKIKAQSSHILGAPELEQQLRGIHTVDEIALAINGLSRKGLILIKKAGQRILYQAISKDEAKRTGTFEHDEGLVYSHIKDAGNMGAWTRPLKMATNLHQTSFNKAIKGLEQKMAIKLVKSVKWPTRKIYMLANLTPSVELTGGPWYSDGGLDQAFIDGLLKVCLNHVKKLTFPRKPAKSADIPDDIYVPDPIYPPSHTKRLPTPHKILEFIVASGISQQTLAVEHVMQLMNVLVYNGQVEILKPPSGTKHEEGWNSDLEGDGGGMADREWKDELVKRRARERERERERERARAGSKKRVRAAGAALSDDSDDAKAKSQSRSKSKGSSKSKSTTTTATDSAEDDTGSASDKAMSVDDDDDGDNNNHKASSRTASSASSASGTDSEDEKARAKKRRKREREREAREKEKKRAREKEKRRRKKEKERRAREREREKERERRRRKKEKERKEKKRREREREKRRSKSRTAGSDSDSDSDSDELKTIDDRNKKRSSSKKRRGSSSDSDSSTSGSSSSSSLSDSSFISSSSSTTSTSDSDSDAGGSKKKTRSKSNGDDKAKQEPDVSGAAAPMLSMYDFDHDIYHDTDVVYRAVHPPSAGAESQVTEAPCVQCPVHLFCSETGPVNPAGCVYYDNWLAMDYV
ncbi:hypothetical protein NliqN6_0754 [Naganishia liquefaciens]|uniref:Uncharacterized protein n=1 Tax=Naganishia liquefaciens TaxID=104408 RepID=A0A8H3TNL1_9TREE|nr:hypothetical protein NliqN6_0754 [Naganishia liquefaciens]